MELIRESDQIYLKFGADARVYGVDKEKELREIRRKADTANLKLIECSHRHLGTEEGYKIYQRLQRHLEEQGVEMLFMTMVTEINIEDGAVRFVTTDKGETYFADEVVAAVGREEPTGFPRLPGPCNRNPGGNRGYRRPRGSEGRGHGISESESL